MFNPVAPPDIKRLTGTGKFVATPKGYEEAVWSTSLECNCRNPLFAKREVRQAMFHAVDRNLIAKTVYYGYARPGTSPIFSPNKEFFTPDTYKTALRSRRRRRRCSMRRAIRRRATRRASRVNLLAAGWFAENGKIGAIVKQGLEDVGIAVNLTVPDRPTSIKRIYTDYDFDLAISNQANPSEPVPSTTQYYTTDGIKKGVPFRNASGFSSPEMDALVEKIKVETDPAKRKALVIEFQKLATLEAPNLPLVELESITVASTRVQNHSNDPELPRARAGTTYGWRPSRLVPPARRAAPPAAAADPGRAADAGRRGDQLRADPSRARQLPRADDGREPGERSRHGRAAAQDLRAGRSAVAAAPKYIWALLHFDFGFSYRQNMPVLQAITIHLPATLLLMVSSITLAFAVGVAAGVVASIKVRTVWDTLVSVAAMFFFAAPELLARHHDDRAVRGEARLDAGRRHGDDRRRWRSSGLSAASSTSCIT